VESIEKRELPFCDTINVWDGSWLFLFLEDGVSSTSVHANHSDFCASALHHGLCIFTISSIGHLSIYT
jgi:hypothetical protein